MTNTQLAANVINFLKIAGVKDLVFCPGSFNSPLLLAFDREEDISVTTHFDERGASFFALGVIKKTGRPVAVCTTSGTAVAECLPAVIEAFYSNLPLIIVSADRAERFIESGAPQVINQAVILEPFTQEVYDLSSPLTDFSFREDMPLHINVRFEEPLFEAAPGETDHLTPTVTLARKEDVESSEALLHFIKENPAPLVIVDAVPRSFREPVVRFLTALSAPVLADARSGLVNEPSVQRLLLKGGETTASRISVRAVIRIGGTPVPSFWRELERNPAYRQMPVFNISLNGRPGLARDSQTVTFGAIRFSEVVSRVDGARSEKHLNEVMELDQAISSRITELLKQFPLSEPSMVGRLASRITDRHTLFVGNSLPIREWNMFRTPAHIIEASRGANGIDGQLATFAGLAREDSPNFGLFGDLTALYDLSSFPLLVSIPAPLTIAVINNRGGQIFSRLKYTETVFSTDIKRKFVGVHNHTLSPFFESAGFKAHSFYSPESISIDFPGKTLLELFPDAEESNQFWRALEEV